MNDVEVVTGSGNVFRDLGKPNADLAQARAILAAKIIGVLDGLKLNLRAAESLTGVNAAEFSRIRNAKLERFTIDRMITILGKLGQEVNVEVSVRPMMRRKARNVGGELPIRGRRSPRWHGAGARKTRASDC
ncbi:MAG TPA: helix-turn-helix transcriptional regulator [Methyloceanibacter sp.]|nr:helix-turn-helix transcriptional regulator [Methyloceanibacter sp.]